MQSYCAQFEEKVSHSRQVINKLPPMVVLAAVPLVLTLCALIDIITRQDWQVKHLPKMMWVLLVIVLPLIGSIVWFAVGREYSAPVSRGTFGDPRRYSATDGNAASRAQPLRLSTEEELAALDREIEYHANQERIAKLEAEIEKRRWQP